MEGDGGGVATGGNWKFFQRLGSNGSNPRIIFQQVSPFHENPFPRISKLSGNSGGGNLIFRNLDGVSRPSLARRRGKGGGGIIGEKLRASGGGGRLRGREGERRGMGRERGVILIASPWLQTASTLC